MLDEAEEADELDKLVVADAQGLVWAPLEQFAIKQAPLKGR